MHKEYETYKRWHAVTMTGKYDRTFISAFHLARFIHCAPEVFWSTCVLPNFPGYDGYSEPLARDLLLTKDMARLILPPRRAQRGERLDWAFEQGPGAHRYEETHRKTHKPKATVEKPQELASRTWVQVYDAFGNPLGEVLTIDDDPVEGYYPHPDPRPAHVGQMDTEQKLAALIRRVDEVYGEVVELRKFIHDDVWDFVREIRCHVLDLKDMIKGTEDRVTRQVRKLMAPDLLDG